MIKAKYLLLALVISTFSYGGVKIVGGEEVTSQFEAPYIVKFRGCAGSIIAKRWILTAAHCARILSMGGSFGNTNSTEHPYKFKVKRVIVHPEYNRSTIENDAALVETMEDLPLNGTSVDSIVFADEEHVEGGFQEAGVEATIYGWGAISQGGPSSRKLLRVKVPIVSNEQANAPGSYNGRVKPSMIAAGLPEGGKDACQGDSGGPMITAGAQGAPTLVGIVSWGKGCAQAKYYGLYSRVSHKSILDFIREYVK